MSEPTFKKYQLRGGSNSLQHTRLIEEVEAASIEDVMWHLSQTRPTENVWIINVSRITKPVMRVAMKLGPPITPMDGMSKF